MCRKMKLGHFLIPHTKINSKWVKDLYGRPETIKILEVNIGSKISGIARSNILSDISSQGRETNKKINKWDYIKPHIFGTAKETINKIKRQSTKWENIFVDTFDKESISNFF